MKSSSDFLLGFVEIWPVILVSDLFRYLIAAGALAMFLAVFAQALERRRIQLTLAKALDIRREIVYSLITVLIFSLVGFVSYIGSQHGIFKIYSGDLPSATKIMLEIGVIVIVHDAYFYWVHRAMHHRKLFRLFHRVHHKSRTPTPWAAYAFAPLEAVVEAGILPLATLVLPMHQLTAFIFMSHMIVRNVIGHAGFELFPGWWMRVPVLRWITTTMHHDLHHSTSRYNYGLYFTWWDRLMGTEHPEYRKRFEAVARSHSFEERKAMEPG